MGKGFGQLARIYGIVFRSLSPYEQKPYAGYLKHQLKDYERRCVVWSYTMVPPFVAGYLLYDWAENYYHHSLRKNPADFENDV